MQHAVEERVREWQMLLEEARAYAGRIRKALPAAEIGAGSAAAPRRAG
jgi:hypothetical protein